MTVAPRRPDAAAQPRAQGGAALVPTSGAVWRRMHPITPVLKGWQIVAVLLVIAGNQVGDNVVNAQRFLSGGGWRWVLLVLAATAVVGGAWASLAWRMTSYAIDEQAVHLRSGILLRQRRQARLDRLQAVDVVKP
ncbi:MAG: PH domain-containing protein, partial [Cellulomonas sp.]